MGHTATLLRNGKVLIVGGIRTNVPDPEFLVDAELYDPKSGSWSPTTSSTQPRAGHTATLLQDGRVLVAGGVGQEIRISNGGYTPVLTNSAEIYDPATETWSATANLITARSGTAILLKSGKVLVIDGTREISRSNYAELFDPVAQAWSPVAPPTLVRFGSTATLLDSGKVLVAGGHIGDWEWDDSFPKAIRAELYDPATDSWRFAGAPLIVFGHSATLLSDGKVMLAGGYHAHVGAAGGDEVQSQNVELFDPATETWTNTGPLPASMWRPASTLLRDGTVLLVDGIDFGGGVERYDPAARRWTTTSRPNVERNGATSTLLPDGKVLVAGGANLVDHISTPLDSAELYDTFLPFAIGPGLTGSWYDPAQSGHGLFVQVLPNNQLLAAWFSFNPAGTQQTWFIGVGTYSGNTVTVTSVVQPIGGRWIPNFDPNRIVNNAWGSLTFTFADCNHGKVDFVSPLEYGTGSMNLTRLTQPAGLSC